MSKSLEERVKALEAFQAKVERAFGSAVGGAASLPSVDIDSQHGDPEVRKDPPKWNGESCVGRRYSECPIDYLESMAGFLQWKAGKNDAEAGKEKYAKYDRLDAARALAWVSRKKTEASRYGTSGHGANAKHTGTPEPVEAEFEDDAGVPF